MDELHLHASHLWLCSLLWDRSRSHPLVLCSWAVLSGSKAGSDGRGWLFQLDRQLHHWHGLPIYCCEYFWTFNRYLWMSCALMSNLPYSLCCLIWSHPSSGPLWAVRLPDLRSSPLLLPHLHILPGARDTGQDFRPDRSKLQRALGRGNDGYGHGHGPGQADGAGLLGGGKHELKTPGLKRYGPEYSLGWTLNVGLTANLIFCHVFWGQLLCSYRFFVEGVFWNCPLLLPLQYGG